MPHLPDHQTHDPLLVAAYAAGDAAGAELDAARDLVASCTECAALHHDLRSIAATMPALPAPRRRRDFRITPEQAEQLRPAGWRRLLAPLAGPRFAFAAPLGGSLAALGIAGILVASAASTPIVSTAGTGASERNAGTTVEAPAATEPGAEALSGPASAAPSVADHDLPAPEPVYAAGSEPEQLAPVGADTGLAAGEPAPSGLDTTVSKAGPTPDTERLAVVVPPAAVPPAGGPPVLVIVSAAVLLAGAILLVLRVAGRRLGAA